MAEVSLVKLFLDECHRSFNNDDKSTLVPAMAWCCQAKSHYLSQCWPRFVSGYVITRPLWVNTLRREWNVLTFAGDILKLFFFFEKMFVSWFIFHCYFQRVPFVSKSALVLVMAWCLTGSKPLPQMASLSYNGFKISNQKYDIWNHLILCEEVHI